MNAVMYYAIGLPLGVVLTFLVGMGIMGTWCGGRGEGLVIVDVLTRPRILQASGWACWSVSCWPPLPSSLTRPGWTGSGLQRR